MDLAAMASTLVFGVVYLEILVCCVSVLLEVIVGYCIEFSCFVFTV